MQDEELGQSEPCCHACDSGFSGPEVLARVGDRGSVLAFLSQWFQISYLFRFSLESRAEALAHYFRNLELCDYEQIISARSDC